MIIWFNTLCYIIKRDSYSFSEWEWNHTIDCYFNKHIHIFLDVDKSVSKTNYSSWSKPLNFSLITINCEVNQKYCRTSNKPQQPLWDLYWDNFYTSLNGSSESNSSNSNSYCIAAKQIPNKLKMKHTLSMNSNFRK